MKKTVKITALCLVLLSFAMLFTGCDYLDEIRANHAVLSESRETLSFRGETYRKLPDDAQIFISNSYGGQFANIAVTDYDVPLLLSTIQSYSSSYDINKDIFSVYIWEPVDKSGFIHSYTSSEENTAYYCNEKDYNIYTEALKNGKLDFAGVEYEVMENGGYYSVLEALSKDFSEEIFGHISNPEKMSKAAYEEIVYNSTYSDCLQSFIYKCDENAIIAQSIDNYDIYRDSDGTAYLVDLNTEKAVKLSNESAKELKDEYFYGKWTEDYTSEDAHIGVIGGADEETDIVAGEANLFNVDF